MSFSEDPTRGSDRRAVAEEDPIGTGAAVSSSDPTLGVEVGEQPYEDPTQGIEPGGAPYDDPTQGGELGSRPGEDPAATQM
jgi:hypothetical protein